MNKYFHWLFHSWSKWELIDQGNLVRKIDQIVIGCFVEQKRTCEYCNLIELKTTQTRINDVSSNYR